MTKTFKIMTLNFESGAQITKHYLQYSLLWKHFLSRSSNPIEGISKFIKKEQIDIATFTEIDGGSFKTKEKNQVKEISNLTNLSNYVFFPTYKFANLCNQGNAICSNYPILNSDNIRLPGGSQARYLGVTNLQIGDVDIALIVTHLSLGKEDRKLQISVISDIVAKINKPIILAGDFNSNDPSEQESLLANSGLVRTNQYKTYPCWKPTKSLDQIFYRGVELVRSYAPKELKVSDHLPLVAEMRV